MPLYNVIVYVPNAELEPFATQVSCSQCGVITSGSPIVTALSNDQGHFQLVDAPAGKDIPLVVQVGKWRRRVVLPEVKPCQDNVLSDPELTRLPRKQSEGDMPRIAVTLGGCDMISCMLPKVGIDSSEFGVTGQNKAVTFYQGAGFDAGMALPWLGMLFGMTAPSNMGVFTNIQPANALWNDGAALSKYDMAVFSCECSEATGAGGSKDATSYQAVHDYLDAGGRIFTTDFQYVWYKFSPDPKLQKTADYPGGAPAGGSPVVLDTSFPKGKAFANWLQLVDPMGKYGEVNLDSVFDNLGHVDPASSQVWASSGQFGVDMNGNPVTMGPNNPRFITINTPVGIPAEQQCGKAVHLDAHVNNTDIIGPDFPAGCSAPMSEGEKAFAFFFFDLASCIQNESEPPKVPPPVLE
jgi:hypothetical protein